MTEFVTIGLISLLIWGIILTASTCKLIHSAKQYRGQCRTEDVVQLFALMGFNIICTGVLLFDSTLIAQFLSTSFAIASCTLFAFVHITQRQYFNCKALKSKTTRKLTKKPK